MKARIFQHVWVLVVLACLLLSLQRGAAQFVELTADIETTLWSPNPAGSEAKMWTTRCIVGTNMWQIEGLFLQEAKSTSWFTGTNLILIHELSRPVGPDQRLLDYTDGPTRFIQVATPSGQRWTSISDSVDGNPGKPARQADLLVLNGKIAWLAFCSGPYLKREGRRLYPSDDLWKNLISAPTGFTDRSIVFPDALGLPRNLNLFTANDEPVLQYRVGASTNVLGWEFPIEFSLTEYLPYPFATNSWKMHLTAKGKVTKITAGAKLNLPTMVAEN